MIITGETVKTGLIKALKMAYPDVKVYKEKVSQNMVEPCFFVMQLPVNSRSGMNSRREQTHNMHVRYHPEKFSYEEMDRVGADLLDLLGQITLEDGLPVFATESSYEISSERYAIVRVTYKINTIKLRTPEAKMTGLHEQIHMKEK